jgi:hypothetical protein
VPLHMYFCRVGSKIREIQISSAMSIIERLISYDCFPSVPKRYHVCQKIVSADLNRSFDLWCLLAFAGFSMDERCRRAICTNRGDIWPKVALHDNAYLSVLS